MRKVATGWRECSKSLPQAPRELAEQTVDQTRDPYEQSDMTLEAAMHSIKKFFDSANQSAAAVNRKIIDITQKNLNLGLDLAKSLAGARDPSEIVKLQASYWWKQFDELTTQAEEVRNRLFGFSTAEPKAPEPSPESVLREPAKKSLTRLQQGHIPAAQDPANARLKQKSDRQKVEAPPLAARTAESGVRPPDETQLGIRKRSTAEKSATSLQGPRPTSRDPAQKQGERKAARTLKARSSSGQATRAGARPAYERQSRTQRKGAPNEPATKDVSTDVKFGMLDGKAVRFNNFEAWWLVDGAWCPISPSEVLSNAAVMREARFKQLFPQVPLLPSNAFQSG